jgi:hypothetical protein
MFALILAITGYGTWIERQQQVAVFPTEAACLRVQQEWVKRYSTLTYCTQLQPAGTTVEGVK